MSLKIITPPDAEPLTLIEAKLHLRVDTDDEDALITSLIVAAREQAEHLTGRALMPQTLDLAQDDFGNRITLPCPPLLSITSVTYVDEAGVVQTLDPADYVIDDHSQPVQLVPPYGGCWPTVRRQTGAVLIRYQAGYADAGHVPDAIKSWMKLQIGMMYAIRESVSTGVATVSVPRVDRLLDPYRFWCAQ